MLARGRAAERAVIFTIVVLAAAVRLALVLLVPSGQYSDSVWYDAAAARLASLGEYGVDGPSAWFPPGYSFFLAAIYKVVGHVQLAGKLGNVVLGTAVVWLTYRVGRDLFSVGVALLAAALLAVWPNLVFHTNILSSDVLATFGFVASVWLAIRVARSPHRRRPLLLGLGVLVGWMVLTRPVSIILFATVGLFWWLETRSFKQAVAWVLPVVLVAGVLVGGWTVRNYLRFGEIITIATNGDYNFWQVNHRYADGDDTFWPWVPIDDPEYTTMWNADELTKNREGYRYGLAYLREHPTHFVAMIPRKVWLLYHSDTSGFYEGVFYAPRESPGPLDELIKARERLLESITFRYYQAVLLLAVPAVLLAHGAARRHLLVVATLPVLLTVFHFLFHAKDRFHLPLLPVFALLAAITVTSVGGWLTTHHRERDVADTDLAPSTPAGATG